MSKTTAPLLSFGAAGQIGKTMVFSKWKGIPYVRKHVIPANPRSAAQTLTRSVFALLREMYKLSPALLRAPWDAFAQGRPFTGMNKFVGENVRVLREELDLANFIASPGARGGLAPVLMVAAPGGAGIITATFTVPAAPDGWAIDGAVASAVRDQDPHGIFAGEIVAAEDLGAPYVVNLAGLTTGEQYVVGGWLRWTKPDGTFAYSVSLNDVALAG